MEAKGEKKVGKRTYLWMRKTTRSDKEITPSGSDVISLIDAVTDDG